jgi:carboxyl-terminal processing protease
MISAALTCAQPANQREIFTSKSTNRYGCEVKTSPVMKGADNDIWNWVLVLVAISLLSPSSVAQSLDKISTTDRMMTASKIYHQISTFFPDLQRKTFDQQYYEYLKVVLNASDDRRDFDLTSMALVASLHDGHSWFYDKWLDQKYGRPLGFTAYPLRLEWVVTRSGLASVKVGDIIVAINGTPTEQYFERSRKYISASGDRDAGVSFFDTPVVFPGRFTMTLDEGRKVIVDREHDQKEEASAKAVGRWLVPGSIGYVRVPTFRGIETQATALEYLKQFHEANTVILDLRGNPGLGSGVPLQRSLMDKPYPMWSESSSMNGGFLLREYDIAYPELSRVMTSEAVIQPRDPVYTGKLILLIDRGCTCACEDFVMPFKVTKRAQLVGETTAGSFSFTNFTQFDNGMMLNIASVRHTFPDGSRFKGIGIAPDVEVGPTVQDLKSGKDVVLEKAQEIANQD